MEGGHLKYFCCVSVILFLLWGWGERKYLFWLRNKLFCCSCILAVSEQAVEEGEDRYLANWNLELPPAFSLYPHDFPAQIKLQCGGVPVVDQR